MTPGTDGMFGLDVTFLESGRRFLAGSRFPYASPLRGLSLSSPVSGQLVTVEPADLLDFLSAGYHLDQAWDRIPEAADERARVAFTVRSSAVKGGGTIMVYRLANWLSDLGVEVSIYADDAPPKWTTVNARYHRLPDPAERFAAITEPVIVAYSILEVPALLQYAEVAGARVFHLCQGAEEFHFGPPPPGGLLAGNAAFDLLNSIPVGRLVVSPHLQRYFAEKYGQQALLIQNGIDLSLFQPGPASPRQARKTVVCAGNPTHPLKGVDLVKAALTSLAQRRPDWELHLVNVCGERLSRPPPPDGPGFTGELRVDQTSLELRDLYRSADAYVNASWYEGFGLPSLEAMACGLPVVQAANHGLQGIAEDGRNCLAFGVGDARGLAAAIERLLSDDGLRDALREGGLRTAQALSLEQQREAAVASFSTATGVDLAARARRPAPGAPLFSVLVPVSGVGRGLAESVESLRLQLEPSWEGILILDGTGEATALAERLAAQDGRFRLVSSPGADLGEALAAGLESARAARICWLSQGDALLPGRLSAHLAVERMDPGLRFCSTGFKRGSASPAAVAAPWPSPELQLLQLLQQEPLASSSVVLHRSVLDALGGFGKGQAGALAASLWLRVAARFRARHLDQVLCLLQPPGSAGATREAAAASAAAAEAFLETRTYPDLFPMLDLGHPDQAVQALVATLRVATEGGALPAFAGGQALLLDRVGAWLSSEARPTVRATCRLALLQRCGAGAQRELRKAASALLDRSRTTRGTIPR